MDNLSTPSSRDATEVSDAVAVVRADWNDLDASVQAALGPAEVALLRPGLMGESFSSLSPFCRVYHVRSIDDAEGTLVAAWDWSQVTATHGTVPITVRASFDAPGMEAEARRLAFHVARRLADLAGVETAPLVIDEDVKESDN